MHSGFTKTQALRTPVAAAALLALLSSGAFAQQATERVEVTGSNIKRLNTETSAPVEIITREDIKATGANTVRQILDTVTATDTGALRDNGNSASFASGATGVGMRGLGKSATLVLLNGRRMGNYGLADGGKDTFVNIDSIAADAIERIEILKDGASAVYGSEAMAGVINIITRKTYNGIGATASYQTFTTPRISGQTTLSVVGGFGNLEKDKFNVYGNLEYYKREGYFLSDIKDYYPEWHKRIVAPAFGDPSTVSYPGNFFPNPASSTRSAHPSCTIKNSAGACVTDLNGINQASDPAERWNFFGGAVANLSNGVQVFADLQVSRLRTDYLSLPIGINAPTTPFRWVDGRTGVLQQVSKPLLPVTSPLNTFGRPAGIEYRFMDPGIDYRASTKSDSYRLSAGARGTVRTWDWEAAVVRAESDVTSGSKGLHRTEFVNAITNNQYQFGGQNSQELLDRMIQTASVNGKNMTTNLDVRATGELFRLPSGKPVQAAVGADFRREEVNIRSSDNAFNAQIIGRGSLLTVGQRDTMAFFGETEAEIFRKLVGNVAFRYDKSENYDGKLTPKFGLKYTVSQNLLVRGTVGKGFRAPNIVETLGQGGLTGFFNGFRDNKRCDAATQIRDVLATGNANDRLDGTAAFNSGCSVSVPAAVASNPGLKPETSQSYTFGVVFEPSRTTSIAVDYFHIERQNEIFYQDPNFLVEKEDDPAYAAFVKRAPVSGQDQLWAARAAELKPGTNITWPRGQLITIFLGYDNLLKTKTSGFDVDLRSRHVFEGLGTVTFGYNATIATNRRDWDSSAGEYLPNLVGLRGFPKVRSVATASIRQNNWLTGLRFNHTTSQSLAGQFDGASWAPENCPKTRPTAGELPCYYRSDYTLQGSVTYLGFKNMRVSATVVNLTARDIPVDLRGGYGIRPRQLKLTAEYRF